MKSYQREPKKICFHFKTNTGTFYTKFFDEPQYTKRRKKVRFDKIYQNQITDLNSTKQKGNEVRNEYDFNGAKTEKMSNQSFPIENEIEKSQHNKQDISDCKNVKCNDDILNSLDQEKVSSFLDKDFTFIEEKYSEEDIELFELEKYL